MWFIMQCIYGVMCLLGYISMNLFMKDYDLFSKSLIRSSVISESLADSNLLML